MARCILSLLLAFVCCRTVAAQGFGGSTTDRTTTGGATSGLGAATQAQTRGTGAATGGLSAAAPFGSGFTFDPRFGATSFATPFGTGIGGGVGGVGGLGGFGGGLSGSRFGSFGGGFGGGFGRGGFGQTQQQNQSKIRATAKVGFEFQAPPAQAQATTIRATLARLPLPPKFEQAQIQFDGRTAVVMGNFKNAEDVAVLKQLLLLEPGVSEVDVREAVVPGASVDVVPAPNPLP